MSITQPRKNIIPHSVKTIYFNHFGKLILGFTKTIITTISFTQSKIGIKLSIISRIRPMHAIKNIIPQSVKTIYFNHFGKLNLGLTKTNMPCV